MQVFLQATLDDASRLIPHAQFYPNQGLDSFLRLPAPGHLRARPPTRLYMDNAKIYRSPQLARIAASIGILIVHTPPYRPEGRGKIERFFRSVREQFLDSLDPQALLSIEQLKRAALALARHRLSFAASTARSSHAAAALAARHRTGTPLPPATDMRRCSFIASTAWCAATHVPAAPPLL